MQRASLFIGTFSLLFSGTLLYLVQEEPFFWDTIQLGARHANWFYQTNFGNGLLPNEMDSGHIPAFGWYLAKCWQFFGRTLLVSHWAMLPWLLLVLWQMHRLASYLNNEWLWPGFLLLLAEPTLLAQLSLVSPDIVLVGCFLWGVNSIFQQDKFGLALAVILLGLVSLRGMMLGVGLFIWELNRQFPYSRTRKSTTIFHTLLPYLPGGILALIYLAYHFMIRGWIGVHPGSPWAESFAGTGVGGMFKQVLVLVWRMIDFGRIFLIIGLILAWRTSGWYWSGRLRQLLSLTLITGLILGLPAVISPGLAQHRYLLPVFLCLGMLFLEILPQCKPIRWRNTLYALVMTGLVSGHFWIYPDTIAQGWDASLAHKAYFAGRAKVLAYVAKNAIPLSDIGTVFPEIGPVDDRELSGNNEQLIPWQAGQQPYVFYSNIMNDFPDDFQEQLHQDYHPLVHYQKRGVTVILYTVKAKKNAKTKTRRTRSR